MEQLFFLLIVAAVGLIRLVSQVAEKRRNSEAEKRVALPRNAPVQRAPAQTEEERVRKFMEALGVPTSSDPPPQPAPPRPIVPQKIPRMPRDIQPIDPFPKPSGTLWNPEPFPLPEPVFVEIPSAPIEDVVQPAPALPPPPKPRPTPSLAAAYEVQRVGLESPSQSSTSLLPLELASAPVAADAPDWIARLATPAGLRDAIILREIFGPPRAMQPL